jgi:hypothetical protein
METVANVVFCIIGAWIVYRVIAGLAMVCIHMHIARTIRKLDLGEDR